MALVAESAERLAESVLLTMAVAFVLVSRGSEESIVSLQTGAGGSLLLPNMLRKGRWASQADWAEDATIGRV
ncbi:MAG: hypothetical protein Fur005_23920 [Roseiflexaceae bacterium]